MSNFPEESRQLEEIAIDHRFGIDGVMFFGHDEFGALVARALVESFASRFFGAGPATG